MGEGGEESSMWDAAESVTNVEPGKAKGARLSTGINRLEKKSVFIASFAWACTLLLIGEEVMV